MTDITKFLTKHPLDKKVGQFAEGELEAYRDKIPDELFKFLEQEQKSVYGNGFFRTVSPKDFHDVFTNWGLDGANCHAFLVSSFGCIEYYYNGDFYGLNPHTGSNSVNAPGNYLSMLMNLSLCNTTNLEIGFCYNLHLMHRSRLPKEDEMYTLVPALPLGGDMETSRVQTAKMDVQLDILAQLYNHKTSE